MYIRILKGWREVTTFIYNILQASLPGKGIDEVFLPWIIKAFKHEIGAKFNNDFQYWHSFMATHSYEDSLTDEPFTSPLITKSLGTEIKTLKHCCFDFNSSHLFLFCQSSWRNYSDLIFVTYILYSFLCPQG